METVNQKTVTGLVIAVSARSKHVENLNMWPILSFRWKSIEYISPNISYLRVLLFSVREKILSSEFISRIFWILACFYITNFEGSFRNINNVVQYQLNFPKPLRDTIDGKILRQQSKECSSRKDCTRFRVTGPKIDKERTRKLVRIKKSSTRRITVLFTGHSSVVQDIGRWESWFTPTVINEMKRKRR